MGAAKQLKMIMLDKGIKTTDFAEMYYEIPKQVDRDKTGTRKRSKSPQTIYNMLSRDNMKFETVENMAEILGCEIVFRDKETGKIY